jgi:hypothetical protein
VRLMWMTCMYSIQLLHWAVYGVLRGVLEGEKMVECLES